MRNLFAKANEAALTAIPVAVDVVQLVKQVADSGILSIPFSMLKGLIAGSADDAIIDKVNTFLRSGKLAHVIFALNTVHEIAEIKDENARLIAILNYYKTATKNEKAEFYSGLAADIATYLADGKLTIAEAYQLSKKFYDETKK